MLEIIQKLQKKIFKKTLNLTLVLAAVSVFAEPCTECNQVQGDLAKEIKIRDHYLVLKGKNEDYLKKPDVPPGAVIKVQSNLVLLGIKIETQFNKIEALKQMKQKLNECTNCPWSDENKS